ncbi:hypothetical protein LRP49_17455 [Enterovibrio sp. ZSDZ35]|uniref:Uncharacterized protein n=1 Tax=Enterovibrio qingdaonensis TaxID=2899818 RepID=A0ABT5QPQ3_9GAMM|nr:hypothetical protein [Enterovibrio sp. ZSDZ35]MDD1782962.1 hypothetical protein [Enterovibrio sp. ZSDZ35]
MELNLTKDQVQTLLNLVNREMSGICGDLGYLELSKIKSILEQQLDSNSSNKPPTQ